MRTVAAMVMAALLTLAPGRGAADNSDGKARARTLFASGQRHYALLEYREALDDFKGAYRAFAEPAILFNIAQCYRQLGDQQQAVKFLRSYLREADDAPNADYVRQLIAEIERVRPQRPTPEPPPEAAPTPAAPMPAETTTASSSRDVTRPWYRSTTGWALAAGGVVGVAVGGGLLGAALSERNAAVNEHTDSGAFDQHHNRSIELQKGAWPLLGIGLASVAAGGIVFALAARRHR